MKLSWDGNPAVAGHLALLFSPAGTFCCLQHPTRTQETWGNLEARDCLWAWIDSDIQAHSVCSFFMQQREPNLVLLLFPQLCWGWFWIGLANVPSLRKQQGICCRIFLSQINSLIEFTAWEQEQCKPALLQSALFCETVAEERFVLERKMWILCTMGAVGLIVLFFLILLGETGFCIK